MKDYIKYYVMIGDSNINSSPPEPERDSLLDSYQEAVEEYQRVKADLKKRGPRAVYNLHIFRLKLSCMH